MHSDTTSSPAPVRTDALIGALRRGDFDGAARLLDGAEPPLPPAQVSTLAEGLMRRRRWADAAWLFSRVSRRDAATEMKRCLAANLAALQAHRPAVYEQIVGLPATNAVGIGASASGRPTVVARRADGSAISLSPAADPLAAARAAHDQVRQATTAGQSVGLCGLGDGYLLKILAEDPPRLFMDMEQALFVIEPRPQVLFHALMIHDYTGLAGPIAAERFRWFVGADRSRQLADASEAEPGIGLPAVTVQQGLDGASVAAEVQSIMAAVNARDDADRRAIEAHYAGVTPGALVELFGPTPPRRPRVLLLTTRFSTVLQYSTRDSAAAFERLGWEARVLIERAPSHRIYRHAIRRAVAEFRPDLVFQIDHLRYEHGDLFPPNLPFVCWAQDHLANLTNATAAASIGPRDFVLVGMPTMYVNRYGYPRERTLMLAKLTHIPQRPAGWDSDGADLVYVSTASSRPADVAAALVEKFGEGSEARRQFVETCCDRVIAHYGRGLTLPAMHDFRELVSSVERETGATFGGAEAARQLADALFDRLGNALYRQQALAWVAEVAGRHGLTLAVYGPGWDAHPLFAPFARGPVRYGPELEELTRRSKINLALEPFFSVSHQRLVDGLVAGGFFLARHHPNNTIIQEVSNFLARRVPPAVATAAEARSLMSAEDRQAFDELAGRFGPLTEFADPVEFVRTSERACLVRPGDDEPLPGLGAISFSSPAELEARILRFVHDPALRAATASRQRETMEARRSYVAGIGRIVNEIGALLANEAEHALVRAA
jgi:hypothetical protein